MSFLTDLFRFLKTRRRWWLIPVILFILILGILLIIGGNTALAPFIYTLF